jgi:hypothetical protein
MRREGDEPIFVWLNFLRPGLRPPTETARVVRGLGRAVAGRIPATLTLADLLPRHCPDDGRSAAASVVKEPWFGALRHPFRLPSIELFHVSVG